MKILVTGSSGLVGTALCDFLTKQGDEVGTLLRQCVDGQPFWDIERKQIDVSVFEPFDAVVHLAGESIASGRWSAQKKQAILSSRVLSTQLLAETLSNMTNKPKVFISASAIGFYGHRGDDVMDESCSHGHDFVSEVATKWEAASELAQQNGIRVVNIRTGLVLSRHGGALAEMLLPFKLGLGGQIGPGNQYMSWISIDDMVKAIAFLLSHETICGPVNLVSPNPVTNREYTKALGKVLKRPTMMTMPSFMARLVFGEMADELLLSSTRVLPAALLKMGFEFKHETIDNAFNDLLA